MCPARFRVVGHPEVGCGRGRREQPRPGLPLALLPRNPLPTRKPRLGGRKRQSRGEWVTFWRIVAIRKQPTRARRRRLVNMTGDLDQGARLVVTAHPEVIDLRRLLIVRVRARSGSDDLVMPRSDRKAEGSVTELALGAPGSSRHHATTPPLAARRGAPGRDPGQFWRPAGHHGGTTSGPRSASGAVPAVRTARICRDLDRTGPG